MKFYDQQEKRLKALDAWIATTYGQLVWQAESDQVVNLIDKYQVKYLVQLGGVPLCTKVCDNKLHFMQIDPLARTAEVGHRVGADFTVLPLLDDSVDMLLCVHAHETVLDPQRLFIEIHRVLKPQGHIVVFSINQVSLWGLGRRLHGIKQPDWCIDVNYSQRLPRFLFKPITQAGLCFRPQMKNRQRLQQWHFLESLGKLCWPNNGTIKVEIMQKQSVAATPLHAAIARPCL